MTVRAVALDTLRALTTDELAAHLREQRGQLFQVRLQQTIGQVENHRQIRAIRKEIARTMTVQVEIRLAAERGEPAPAPSASAPALRTRRAAAAEVAVAPRRTRRAKPAAEDAAVEPVATEPVADAISAIEVERVTEPEAAAETTADTDTHDAGAPAGADKDEK